MFGRALCSRDPHYLRTSTSTISLFRSVPVLSRRSTCFCDTFSKLPLVTCLAFSRLSFFASLFPRLHCLFSSTHNLTSAPLSSLTSSSLSFKVTQLLKNCLVPSQARLIRAYQAYQVHDSIAEKGRACGLSSIRSNSLNYVDSQMTSEAVHQ